MYKSKLLLVIALLMLMTSVASSALAQAPEGPVVLTLSGKISQTNADEAMLFDRDMLEALPQVKVVTQTPWFDDVSEFEGPLASAVLEAAGADYTASMRVTALNDFSAVIPASDFKDLGVILAMKRDGEVLRVRDKGPLFIIYPFDDNPDLNSEVYYNRSVWQIKSIELY
ncbi:hypothetical protein [Nitrincola sp.]|uniref:hypothetical protein n=1 Tax=Nitrincola sp. TaxID=1926584 RepID=UPI003A8E0D29